MSFIPVPTLQSKQHIHPNLIQLGKVEIQKSREKVRKLSPLTSPSNWRIQLKIENGIISYDDTEVAKVESDGKTIKLGIKIIK